MHRHLVVGLLAAVTAATSLDVQTSQTPANGTRVSCALRSLLDAPESGTLTGCRP